MNDEIILSQKEHFCQAVKTHLYILYLSWVRIILDIKNVLFNQNLEKKATETTTNMS